MMISRKKSEKNSPNSSKFCKLCNGKGTIEIFRDDLEEFEQVECECMK